MFSRNFAASNGGGIDHEDGDAVYRNTTVKNNTTGNDGGGIDIDGGTVRFINSKILDNTSVTSGGGIRSEASLTLIKTEVSGNVAGGTNGKGGGILQIVGTLVLRDSSVHNNSTNGSGTSQAGGGIYNELGAVTLDHSVVNNNASTTAPGGVWTDTQFTVNRSEIRRDIPVIVTGCVG